MLHSLGCLQYSPSLEHHIRQLLPIESGHSWEVQLRGKEETASHNNSSNFTDFEISTSLMAPSFLLLIPIPPHPYPSFTSSPHHLSLADPLFPIHRLQYLVRRAPSARNPSPAPRIHSQRHPHRFLPLRHHQGRTGAEGFNPTSSHEEYLVLRRGRG